MLSKPVIEILTGSLVSGQSEGFRTGGGSRTPSPRPNKKSYDFGGIGLGIVAALENSEGITASSALFSRNMSRSRPIPTKNVARIRTAGDDDGGRKGDDRPPFRIPNSSNSNCGGGGGSSSVFHISPPRFAGEGYPAPDFLSSCNLCEKKLHGKDIYMYRGEKAYCSAECRYRQIVVDERTEKCSSEVSKPAVEVAAGSPYTNGQIFATAGILAI